MAEGLNLESLARGLLRPRTEESVWAWAERNVKLSVKTSPGSPGRYDSSWIAYTRGWQEAWSNQKYREIVICAPAQSGKTESLLNCIRYAIAEDPGPLLYITDSETNARSFSEQRLQDSIRDCPPCAAKIYDDRDKFKLLEMHLRDCVVRLVGSNSPGRLASFPVRYVVADEIDKYPEASAKEAGALELAKVRVTTFWNSKIILTSTPTIETGQIWQSYLSGSRHRYYVKCPHCDASQILSFKQIKWPADERTKDTDGVWKLDDVEALAFYECEHCLQPIEHRCKAVMTRGGTWIATNPGAPKERISFHISALYSPWITWGQLAKQFLESKDFYSKLQDFTNSRLAEPWKVQAEEIVESKLHDLKQDYVLGLCPVMPAFALIAVDVQRDCVFYTARAYSATGDSWLIEYGKLPELDALDAVRNRQFKVINSDDTFTCRNGIIDSGYSAQKVYEFCSVSNGFWIPAKGWERLQQPLRESEIKFLPGGTHRERVIRLIHFDDFSFKSDLYLRRIQDKDGPKFHLPSDVGRDYLRQMTAEKLEEKKDSKGYVQQIWKTTSRDNHYGDCEKMQLVLSFKFTGQAKEQANRKPAVARPPARRSTWVNSWKGN